MNSGLVVSAPFQPTSKQVIMDEAQLDSSSNSNNVVSTTTEVPLALAADCADAGVSLPSCSEQNYISELTVLLMRSSQESAAAAASSSQNWPHKGVSINVDEIEPERIRDVISSSSRDHNNAADATLPADLISKVKVLHLDDTLNTTIDLTSSSDVLEQEQANNNNETIVLSSDEETSPDVIVLKHRHSVQLAKKDLTNSMHDDIDSLNHEDSLSQPAQSLRNTQSEISEILDCSLSIQSSSVTRVNETLETSLPDDSLLNVSIESAKLSTTDRIVKESKIEGVSEARFSNDSVFLMSGKKRTPTKERRSSIDSARKQNEDSPLENREANLDLMSLKKTELQRKNARSLDSPSPASSGRTKSSTKEADKNSGVSPRALIKACSVVLERYNPFKSTKVSPLHNRQASVEISPMSELMNDKFFEQRASIYFAGDGNSGCHYKI